MPPPHNVGPTAVTVHDAVPYWPAPIRPPAGAPNVLMIVLDDVGFAQVGAFGARIDTPRMDALASAGLRYSNFHVTALCSTTRASLLTGRNHHTVGMGFLADFDTGYPNSRGSVSPAAGTLAEMLGTVGYGTYAVGKWHLASPAQMSPSGPFHQWPTGRGFDRWYGFLWGEDDQWAPELWHDHHRVEPPSRPDYHLSEDLVDRSIGYLADHITADPTRPFFSYVAFGACHAPHQAPRSFIDKYRGRFDDGWDLERERVLQRQFELGVVPAGTELAPRNPGVLPWAGLPPGERHLYTRMQETFAGFMEHTDVQIGRLVSFLADAGALDNTIVIVLSDNGASGEGGEHGTVNEYRYFLGLEDSLQDSLEQFDELGGPRTHNHYPAGWAQAGNTPFRYYKRYTFAGGIRTPLIIKPPAAQSFEPGVRDQFHHVTDLVPTVLELAGLTAPTVYRGIEQLPVHGTSMRYTFAEPDAPSTRHQQYFETAGHRGLIRDGWKILTNHDEGAAFGDDEWELYDIDADRAELHDVSTRRPDIRDDLIRAWWGDAEKYGVLPLDDRARARAAAVDPAAETRRNYRFLPDTRALNRVLGPDFAGRSFSIVAEISCSVPPEGVLMAHGRRAAGFALYMIGGNLRFDYNLAGKHTALRADGIVTEGEHRLGVRLDKTGEGAVATLTVDGVDRTRVELARTLPGGFGCLSTQAGHNSPSPVSDEYASPFRFTGTLRHVDVELGIDQDDTSADVWRNALSEQ